MVINLPRLRVDLLKLNLVEGNNLAIRVENKEAGASGALVNGTNKSGIPRCSHVVDEFVVSLGNEVGNHKG